MLNLMTLGETQRGVFHCEVKSLKFEYNQTFLLLLKFTRTTVIFGHN